MDGQCNVRRTAELEQAIRLELVSWETGWRELFAFGTRSGVVVLHECLEVPYAGIRLHLQRLQEVL